VEQKRGRHHRSDFLVLRYSAHQPCGQRRTIQRVGQQQLWKPCHNRGDPYREFSAGDYGAAVQPDGHRRTDGNFQRNGGWNSTFELPMEQKWNGH
jgi:hypothetical protein